MFEASIYAVKKDILGRSFYLLFTNRARFALIDRYGDDFLEALDRSTREGYEATAGVFCILAEEGELARRRRGYEPAPIATAEEMMPDMTPADWSDMKQAVVGAIIQGTTREIKPAEDVDLILLEYQKKTGGGSG